MSHSCDDGPATSSDRNNDAVREDPAVASASGDDSGARLGSDTGFSVAEAVARVSVAEADRSDEAKGSDGIESEVVKLENEESKVGEGSGGSLESQPSPSVSRDHDSSRKKSDVRNVKSEHKKLKPSVEDYDSMLSEFDQYAAKGVGEAVGYGYEIGDMVWGKVRSHPWWPGYIYNEAFASSSVWKAKRDGHVLVAFFGDSSYGWFELAELIPFAENFAEKSRQTSSRGFVKAVEEAVGEFSRRRSLGLSCRCRNEFNFWPFKVLGYFIVDLGDFEPGIYSLSQINKARENFRPKEMLSFVEQLALTPRTNQHGTIEFIKNKATVLACRKALYEEFDETYAQAFGSVPERPPRPTMPVALDPTKGPLSGPLVFAEALGKGKHFVKPTKAKNQMEDRYILKRRDEPMPMNVKKTSAGQSGSSAYPFLVDGSMLSAMPVDSGMGDHLSQTSLSDISDGQHQATSHKASANVISEIKPSEKSRKIVEGGFKKPKIQKQHKKELSAENATLVEKKKKRKKYMSSDQASEELSATNVPVVEKKKRKKEMISVPSADPVQLPVANSNSGVAVEKVSGVPLDFPVPLSANNQLDTKKDGAMGPSMSLVEAQQTVEKELEFPMLLRDLHALALNPFHGAGRGCPSMVKQIFLKFRSLVFQKSLVLLSSENERSETRSTPLSASTASPGRSGKTLDKPKLIKRPVRPDDPTKGGKKRSPPSDRPEAIKKKKLNESQDSEKKKRIDLESIKKKKIVGDAKLSSVEKKIHQRLSETQRENVKGVASKYVTSSNSKALKLESSKRMEVPAKTPNRPTMLVMKFQSGAALPSGAELRAKFARFGPMDHSATRVFWKSYTCRLVFRKKVDADAALKYAQGTNSLFGNTNVKSFTREVEVEAAEPDPVKVQKDDFSAGVSQAREAAGPAARISVQPPNSTQLKSCLKKPSAGSEEGGNGSNGNNGRGTRVKFVLGGEGSSKTEQVSVGATATSYAHSSMDVSSKNMAKLIPQSTGTPLPATHHRHHHRFQRFPNNVASNTSSGEAPKAPKNDISQQFLNLLTRCSDVVNNLTGALGYVPYHSL